ncbi:CBS domain-containing protein [Ornithinibacillus bavariensis]|uniref:CBS domain-containing protein n=1 Tax=Ornithinibacillus bavariensis TaxID=545502 RepID=A0A920C6N1_9BACI|nr:CBS domain-containing protein [Ornithinibacillus bavariensis]GIO26274.1 CBS domain-containing protein [Ornithinibacillus bavariensis]
MKIQDFMISDVISVKEDTTVKELLQILVNNKIGGVPVVNNDNVLVGVISDGDVIRYLQPSNRNVFDMFSVILFSDREELVDKLTYALKNPVKRMMRTRDLKTLHPNNKLDEALQIFARYHFKKIPVIDDSHRVVGVISRGDLLRHITNHLIQ